MEGTAGSFPKLCLGEGNDHPLSLLAWRTPQTEAPGRAGVPFHGVVKESDTTERLTLLKLAAALDGGQQENKDLKHTAARNPLSATL